MISSRRKKDLVLDGTKLLYHLDVLNAWLRGERIFPIFVELSPVGACNQACVFCAYEYLKRQPCLLDTRRTCALLDEFADLGVKSVFFSGEGEPLLHKDIACMIVHAKTKGIDVALNTNGVLLTKEVSARILGVLSWMRLSINAGTEESYRRIHRARRGDFGLLMRNLEAAVRVKKRIKSDVSIGAQLVYLKQPFDEIMGLARRLKSIGLDYFAVKQFNKHPLSRFNVRVSRGEVERLKEVERLGDDSFHVAVRESFDAEKQKRHYTQCYGFEFFAEVKCDGGVYPCGPLLGLKEYCYGNVNRDSFKRIWLGKKRSRVVKKIFRGVDVGQCMPNCRLHNINEFLWKLKSVPEHVNFI
jgi:GTP 3',8-cyclase